MLAEETGTHVLCAHALCSFVVLVCGTLVYGKGDELEHKKEYEALLADGEAPSSTSAPPAAAPVFAPIPDGAARTAPMAMATPSSYKVLPFLNVLKYDLVPLSCSSNSS
jgi:hypothetical protein